MRDANLIGGPLSIAVEFVLQLVDFQQPTARMVGWALAALLAVLALFLFLRRRLDKSSAPTALQGAVDLGEEMLRFIRMRESSAPPPASSAWPTFSFLPMWDRRTAGTVGRDSHDAETMSIWTGRFAKKLSATLAKLHGVDRIDHAEVRHLLLPRSPAEVRSVAFRLIELGCQEA